MQHDQEIEQEQTQKTCTCFSCELREKNRPKKRDLASLAKLRGGNVANKGNVINPYLQSSQPSPFLSQHQTQIQQNNFERIMYSRYSLNMEVPDYNILENQLLNIESFVNKNDNHIKPLQLLEFVMQSSENNQVFLKGEVENEYFQQITTLYPELINIEYENVGSLQQMIEITMKYETKSNEGKDVSFYFNRDGSFAILCEILKENYSKLKKIIKDRSDFQKLYLHQESSHILLIVNQKVSFLDYEYKEEQYNSSVLTLNELISSKFEKQKELFHQVGFSETKQIYRANIIENQRLRNDLKELFECLDDQFQFKDNYATNLCFAYYTQHSDFNLLEGLIIGPQNTPFENIPYTLTIKIKEDYPHSPPNIVFNEQILHPNISSEGKFCLDFFQENWTPAYSIKSVLISIISLLHDPMFEDVYNYQAKMLYESDLGKLRKQIKQQAITSGSLQIEVGYDMLLEVVQEQKQGQNPSSNNQMEEKIVEENSSQYYSYNDEEFSNEDEEIIQDIESNYSSECSEIDV